MTSQLTTRSNETYEANDNPKVLDENGTNWLVQFPDGSTQPVTKSTMNRLLYEHNLWGLLKGGDQMLVIQRDDSPNVEVIPNDDSTEFIIEVGHGDPLHLGQHHKSALIDVLATARTDDGFDPEPVIDFYEQIRGDRIREDLMRELGSKSLFRDAVEVTADGWLIHDHLLLTWESEFYHPDTTTRTVHGSAVSPASSEPAYSMSISKSPTENRNVTVNGERYRFTDAEMTFLAKGLWGITKAPTPDAAERNADDFKGTPGLTPEVI